MIVYRLSKSKYSHDLNGKGAEIAGGRWNSKGTPMIYTAESRALALTEIAVHLPYGIMPKNYQMVTIEIPDDIPVQTLPEHELPIDWRTAPHSHSTQVIGDKFVRRKEFLPLRVPSAIVEGDSNILINPLHPDLQKITILAIANFTFDRRLFQ